MLKLSLDWYSSRHVPKLSFGHLIEEIQIIERELAEKLHAFSKVVIELSSR